MKRVITGIAIGLLLTTSGCETIKGLMGKQDEQAAASASVTPPTPAPEAKAEPADDGADIPTQEDFEDEAFEKVTEANYKTELEALEKEIEGN